MTKLDFVLAGGERCGTSLLARYLGSHPEIEVSSSRFFDFNYPHDTDWFAQQIKGTKSIVGERSSLVLYTPEGPPRVREFSAEVARIKPPIHLVPISAI